MANPSEEPLVERGMYADLEDQINVLKDLTERQRTLLSNAEAANAELMLENANAKATAAMESDMLVQNERLGAEVVRLRQVVDDQSEEIADCKILKYEAILDEMEEFCSVRPDIDGDDPVKCGWRTAILRMREIRRG